MFPLEEIDCGAEYYALTLGADEDSAIWSEGYTRWKGYADNEGRVEIRALAVVNASSIAKIWKNFGHPFMVVNDDAHFAQWFLGGGHALIRPKLLEAHMPWEIEPDQCVHEMGLGFSSAANIPHTAFNRAPTPKLRMAVMERDQYRCVLCGRSPSNYLDVELHVHHIRPFGQRGLTMERNLITLCHTCHKGLVPHYNWSLYGLINRKSANIFGQSTDEARRVEYLRSVERYRAAIAADLKMLSKQKTGEGGNL